MTVNRPKPDSGKRIPAPTAPAENFDHQPPSFCLRHISQKHCITGCSQEQKGAFADRLYELSRNTWVQLRMAGKKGGCEKIPRDAIREPIPACITPDVAILAFRFWGRAPMVGFREGRTFYVVWLDINFNVYNHG